MVTIKSYTDLEQSKKLAEILPLESADMYYPLMEDNIPCERGYPKDEEYLPGEDIECWSLAALLSVLSLPNLTQDKADDELFWQCSVYDEDGTLLCETYDNNAIDACYEIIVNLNEQKIL